MSHAMPATGANATPTPFGRLITADRIEPEAVAWQWHNYLPVGKLVLIDGDPGLGKSAVMISIAASVTTGQPFPDGSRPTKVGGAVILAAEDGQADTVIPRLIAAGADRSRIIVLHAADSAEPFSIPSHLDRLATAIEQVGAVLVVLDPITAYLEGDINKDQELRRCLRPLLTLIAERGVVAIGSRHLNKDASMKALYRGGGSIAMIGQARVALLVGEDQDDEDTVVMACSKANLGPKPSSLRYRVTGTSSGAAVVEWLGQSERRADDLVEAGRAPDFSDAEKVIRELIMPELAAGPMSASKADAILRENGVTAKSSINRAKARLNIKSAKVGASWLWQLRELETPVSPTTLIRNVGNVENVGNLPKIPKSPKIPPLQVVNDNPGEPEDDRTESHPEAVFTVPPPLSVERARSRPLRCRWADAQLTERAREIATAWASLTGRPDVAVSDAEPLSRLSLPLDDLLGLLRVAWLTDRPAALGAMWPVLRKAEAAYRDAESAA